MSIRKELCQSIVSVANNQDELVIETMRFCIINIFNKLLKMTRAKMFFR